MTYSVKEIYYTLQGEGGQAGRAAVFCRFTGCNLWTGREEDRTKAVCQFCDTDFIGTNGPGGDKFGSAQLLAQAVARLWPKGERGKPLVVFTGGEPLLQLDQSLVDAMHEQNFEIAVETNGTQPAPNGIDWICVSPKADAELVLTKGSELKLVFPQLNALPERFAELDFQHFFLQPMDGLEGKKNTRKAIEYCLQHPQWRLSIQTHKVIGIA